MPKHGSVGAAVPKPTDKRPAEKSASEPVVAKARLEPPPGQEDAGLAHVQRRIEKHASLSNEILAYNMLVLARVPQAVIAPW